MKANNKPIKNTMKTTNKLLLAMFIVLLINVASYKSTQEQLKIIKQNQIELSEQDSVNHQQAIKVLNKESND